MKASMINGKGSAAHNDRTYNKATTEEQEELLWKYNVVKTAETFKDGEIEFYKRSFGTWLKNQNEKYEKRRQNARIKTMEDIVGGPNLSKKKGRYEPTETILQIGKYGEKVPPKLFYNCVMEYCAEINRRYKSNMRILNIAIHKEKSTVCHAHIRRVWFAKNEHGEYMPNKDKALEELGFSNADRYGNTAEKRTRCNNKTIAQTAEERAIWYEICKAHGIEIDEEPDILNTEHHTTEEHKIIEDAHAEKIREQEQVITRNEKRIKKQEEKKKELGIAFDDMEINLDTIIEKAR